MIFRIGSNWLSFFFSRFQNALFATSTDDLYDRPSKLNPATKCSQSIVYDSRAFNIRIKCISEKDKQGAINKGPSGDTFADKAKKYITAAFLALSWWSPANNEHWITRPIRFQKSRTTSTNVSSKGLLAAPHTVKDYPD